LRQNIRKDMSEDFSNRSVLVVDHGLFLPLARRLAKDFGRVYYHTPWEKAWPLLNEGAVGAGFENVVRCEDVERFKKKADLFVFPDLYHLGLQLALREEGRRVWGAGRGMRLEVDREFFMDKLAELGLAVAPHRVVTGVSALADYLRDKHDQFIKISLWRGSFETEHWRDAKQDGHKLARWALRFGPFAEHVRFLVFEPIETKLEIGADTYNVHGQWPGKVLHGIEKKDEAYFAAVTGFGELPEELAHIMEAFRPFLAGCEYACQWSMEVRVTEDEAYFIDATTRGGLPSSATFLVLPNLSEILWQGAAGELVEPEFDFAYAAEAMVSMEADPDEWNPLVLPTELETAVQPFNCCQSGDTLWFPPAPGEKLLIGWLGATGDDPKELARRMNKLADQLPDGVTAAVESLADIFREIPEEEAAGIRFGDEKMPDPEIVLEPAS
jgi:hypothetical protein